MRTTTRDPRLAESILEDLWFGDDDPNRPLEQASASLAAAMAEIQGLKPFPAVAHKVMQLASREDCRIEEVASVIGSDPSLASRTLRLANSAAFGAGSALDSVLDAMVRLGLRRVTSMMTAISVMGMFDDSGRAGHEVRDHCVSVATLAQTLARGKNWSGHERLFLAGLFHDVGRLLLMQTGDLKVTPNEQQGRCDSVHLFERVHLGYDHAVLGGHVLRLWSLPENVSRVVAWHHQPARAYAEGGDVGLQVAFLEVADTLDQELLDHGTWSPEFLAQAEQSSAFCYAGVTHDDLVRHSSTMLEARSQALDAFR